MNNQTSGSDMRTYALGFLVAGIASLFVGIGTLCGIATGLFIISFCLED